MSTSKKNNVPASGNKKEKPLPPNSIKSPTSSRPVASTAHSAFSKIVSGALQDGVRNIATHKVEYDKALIGRLKKIVAQYTETPEMLDHIEGGSDDSFIEQLNIDSVDFVEIIVDAEEEFHIKIEDEEIKFLKTFDDLYLLIEGKVKSIVKETTPGKTTKMADGSIQSKIPAKKAAKVKTVGHAKKKTISSKPEKK